MKVYNNENLHSYTAVLSNTDEHGMNQIEYNFMGSSLKQENSNYNCIMSITNFSCFHDGNWVPIVYLQGKGGLQVVGFYLCTQNLWEGDSSLITYAHPPEGMLTIISRVLLHVVPVGPPGHGLDLGSNPDPGLVYDNYCKDYRSSQYHGSSYEDYMISIIDDLIFCAENSIRNADHPASGMGVILGNDQYHKQTSSDACVTGITHTEHDPQLVQRPSLGQSYESSTTDRDIPHPN